jgi:serine/threonine-protein kinase HipA
LKTGVWLWLDQLERVADFEWDEKSATGMFTYRKEYLARPDAIALDPIELPLIARTIRSRKFGGLPGVIRDACPDAWGKSVLERTSGRGLSDLEAGILSPPDTVGAIALGEEGDISRKRAWQAPGLAEISLHLTPADGSSILTMPTTTGLGGAKPKMTVMHDGRLWLMKKGERGDPPDAVIMEHVMLELARLCGIKTAQSEAFAVTSDSPAILVERFDFKRKEDGFRRIPFASAASLMQFDTLDRTRGQPSYRRFMQDLRRWSAKGGDSSNALAEPRELWRRVVFNGLVANVDDHSRNHGVIFENGAWILSPAFDINAGYGESRKNVALSMNLVDEKSGASVVTVERLVTLARTCGIQPDEAYSYITESASIMLDSWQSVALNAGVRPDRLSFWNSAFFFAREIQ